MSWNSGARHARASDGFPSASARSMEAVWAYGAWFGMVLRDQITMYGIETAAHLELLDEGEDATSRLVARREVGCGGEHG